MTKSPDSRELALDILIEILEKGGYSHLVLGQALNKYQYLEKQERAFVTRLVEGTLEYLIQLDEILNRFSKVPVKKMKPVIRNILRLSVYQIRFMDRVPDSAACNEAVKLASKRGYAGLKGFVNGLLRSIARSQDQIVFEQAWIRYSIPQWIFSLWEDQYGRDRAESLSQALLQEKPLSVRCVLSLASREEIIASLQAQEVEVEESAYSRSILLLRGFDYLEGLDAFQKGFIQVQDLSSSLVGQAAGIRPDDYVIDVCGAPGGKGLHMADQLKGTGMVEVRDLTPYKVGLIQDNIDRSGVKNIRARVMDALVSDPGSVEQADVLLCDLPCSGLGIIGRKPDIKYRMTMEQIDSLVSLQRQILSVVWQYVKPGGTLVYSTCTIDRKENEDNLAWMMEQFPLEAVSIEGRLGDMLQEESLKQGYIQLLPDVHPCDGFFLAVLRRKDGNSRC